MCDWRNDVTGKRFAFAAGVRSSTKRDQSNAYLRTATEPMPIPLGLTYACGESISYPKYDQHISPPATSRQNGRKYHNCHTTHVRSAALCRLYLLTTVEEFD